MKSKAKAKAKIQSRQLRFWKLFAIFQEHLQPVLESPQFAGKGLDKAHPRRELDSYQYLTLWLMAMLNPVIDSMRGLCQASELSKVQEQTGIKRVSLGSFSEAQGVLKLGILPQVIESLLADLPEQVKDFDPSWPANITLVDSSLWAAVERMTWANWRHQHKTQKAVRLHVEFNLLKGQAEVIKAQEGRSCERAYLRENLRPGQFYVGDRNYGRDHSLLNQMQDAGCQFIIRGREAILPSEVLKIHPLSQEDKDAGMVSDRLVRLGKSRRCQTLPLRQITLMTDCGETLTLLTTQSPQEMPAHMVAAIYRARWRIELYFKWIKSILKNRHFLAESPEGVVIQMYMALIAAILLQAITGRRPTKRQMEMIQYFLMGWIDEPDLKPWLESLSKKATRKNS